MLKTSGKIECFGVSDIGLVRDHNEDVFEMQAEQGIFALADGIGGQNAGEIAADIAVQSLVTFLKEKENPKLEAAFSHANVSVYKESLSHEEWKGMGTTLCAIYFTGTKAVYGHVGDSRIYLWRKGSLVQLTRDHSLINDMIDQEGGHEDDPHLSCCKHVLTKAIGTQRNVCASINELLLEKGDIFLLCSDGLTNFVTQRELERQLRHDDQLSQCGHSLVELAKSHGGSDNITLILVRIADDLS